MSLVFKKINLNFKDFDFGSIISNCYYINRTDTLYQYHILENTDFVNLLNKKVIFKIKPDITNITKITYPGTSIHKDTWKTGLNYFISLGEQEITTFYANPAIKVNFEKDTAYLINTHCPHSVKMVDPNSSRYILRFAWLHHCFEEIDESIILL